MVEAVGPSVVQIDAKGEARAVRTPFGYLRQPGHEAMGSGFIVDESGVVITNNHVIDGATTVRVKLSDGTIRQARVLGRDAKTDLAVLRIEGGGIIACRHVFTTLHEAGYRGPFTLDFGRPEEKAEWRTRWGVLLDVIAAG